MAVAQALVQTRWGRGAGWLGGGSGGLGGSGGFLSASELSAAFSGVGHDQGDLVALAPDMPLDVVGEEVEEDEQPPARREDSDSRKAFFMIEVFLGQGSL